MMMMMMSPEWRFIIIVHCNSCVIDSKTTVFPRQLQPGKGEGPVC